MWFNLSSNVILKQQLSKYFKLMEISIDMVLGNVEDEWCFSTIFLWTLSLEPNWQPILNCLFKNLFKIDILWILFCLVMQ
jgi:hypothetical protein